MSRSESIDFLRCIESDKELKKLFINMQNYYALTRIIPEKNDKYTGKVAYQRFMQTIKRRNIRRLFVRTMAHAATVAMLLGVTWYFAAKSPETAVRTTEVYSPPGQRTKIILDDGTLVWLNARTTLLYASDFSQNRHVTINGEAFFEVAANPKKPFTVATQRVNITALGTKFNVSCYPENDETQIALIEGSVKVWDESGRALILKPQQQALYSSNRLSAQPIEHEDYFLWTKGVYSFVNEPLTDVVKKLERYYDIKIEITAPLVLDDEFTGKFRQQDGVDMILRMIQHLHPFKIEKNEEKIVLTK